MSDTMDTPPVYKVETWIEENQQYFLPPVCNKMMYGDGQMKLFFVGGPNQRKDYHMESGEEVKGDMVLKIVERGQHKDIVIREGEIFLLPGRIQHSPQRHKDTVGLVLERERHRDTETDGIRYFVETEDGVPTTDVLYEKWFYCNDLGTELGPIIKGYFASEQHKTGKPLPGTILDTPPLDLDHETTVEAPFSLSLWLQEHAEQLDAAGRVQLFDGGRYQFQVFAYGGCEQLSDSSELAETWIWQMEGASVVEIAEAKIPLAKDESVLVPRSKRFSVTQSAGCRALVCYQDPRKAPAWPESA